MPPSDDTAYTSFVTLFTRHEARLRSFVRSMLPGWSDVDEVMQQVGLVIWRKFGQFDPATEFLPWACVIARFEALHYRRSMARDRLVFGEALIQQLAEEGAAELDVRVAQSRALEGCLEKLRPANRELLLQSCTPGVKTKDLAEQLGKQPGALYTLLNRLRGELLTCVEDTLRREECA